MKFTWEITKAWFLHVKGKFFEKPHNGKNPTKEKNNSWNQDETDRGQTELKRRKKERKKQQRNRSWKMKRKSMKMGCK